MVKYLETRGIASLKGLGGGGIKELAEKDGIPMALKSGGKDPK